MSHRRAPLGFESNSKGKQLNVFVTGATGFIGGHLCAALAGAGHQVVALCRPGSDQTRLENLDGVRRVDGDVTVPASLRAPSASADAVVHLAGTNHANKASTYYRVNRDGTQNVAASVPAGAHFILMSALAAQGPSAALTPTRTAGAEAPIGDYGRSKLSAEHVLSGRDNTTILRPAITYGPGDPQLLNWCKLVRRRIVPIVADLQLSFLHVDDLCSLVVQRLAAGAARGPWLLSDGEPVSMGRAVDLVEGALSARPGARLPVPSGFFARIAPFAQRLSKAAGLGHQSAQMIDRLAASGWACDPADAQQELGFAPQISLAAGIRQTIGWYTDNGWL